MLVLVVVSDLHKKNLLPCRAFASQPSRRLICSNSLRTHFPGKNPDGLFFWTWFSMHKIFESSLFFSMLPLPRYILFVFWCFAEDVCISCSVTFAFGTLLKKTFFQPRVLTGHGCGHRHGRWFDSDDVPWTHWVASDDQECFDDWTTVPNGACFLISSSIQIHREISLFQLDKDWIRTWSISVFRCQFSRAVYNGPFQGA